MKEEMNVCKVTGPAPEFELCADVSGKKKERRLQFDVSCNKLFSMLLDCTQNEI